MENSEQNQDTTPEETTPAYNEKDNRTWAILTHIGGFGFFIIPFLGNIIAPLVIWLIKKDELPLVNQAGKEAVNFQISISIYGFIAFLLCFIFIGIPIAFIVFIFSVVMIIKGAMQASEGKEFTYPLSIRFIK